MACASAEVVIGAAVAVNRVAIAARARATRVFLPEMEMSEG
jgi:hypothetical protein